MSSNTEPESKTDKPATSAPNFLGKLWKSQVAPGSANDAAGSEAQTQSVELNAKQSSTAPKPVVGSPRAKLQVSGNVSSREPAPLSGLTNSDEVTPVKSANTSKFLSKLWKAQKESVDTGGYENENSIPVTPLSAAESSGNLSNKTVPASEPWIETAPTPSIESSSAQVSSSGTNAETILAEGPEPLLAADSKFSQQALELPGAIDASALNTQTATEEYELSSTPSPGELDAIKAPDTMATARTETDALAQRKAALAAYEKMKEEQRLKTERSRTVRIPTTMHGGHSDTTVDTDSNSDTDNDSSSLTRQSFNSTAKPAPQDIPQAPRGMAARRAFSKHPVLIVLSIAALAGAIAYFPTENANSNFNEGESRLASGDARGAVEKLSKVIASKPRFEDAYLARARAYVKLGALDLAQADCTTAIGLNAGKVAAFEQRADIELDRHHYRLAIDDIDSVAKIRGTLTPKLLWNLGQAYLGDGQYGKALIQFSKRLDRDPQDILSLVAKARCYEEMNLPRQAISLCRTALSVDKNAYEALVLKARCEALSGDQTQARTDLDQAVAMRAERPEAFVQRGLLSAQQKDFTQALNDLNTAIKLPASLPEARYQLAMVHAMNSEKDKALEQFSYLEARQDFKTDNWFLINRSNTYAELKDFNHAFKDLQTALSSDRAYLTTCWLKLAECFESTKNYKQAAIYAAKVLVDEPSNSLALLKHSQYSRLSGNQMTAMSDLFKAIEVDPNNPNVYAARGDVYAANKQFNLADIDYRKASELAPLNVEFKKKLLACNVQTRRARPEAAEPSNKPASLSATAQSEIASANLATLKTKGYQALKAGDPEYAVAALTRAVYLDKNDANARRYLAYALLKMNDPGAATSQFYAWENIANPDPTSEISFVKSLALTTDASDVFEHLAERYRTNAPVLLEIARQCKYLNYTPIAISALDFGSKIANSDELVSFNRLRISLQQTSSGSSPNPVAAPSAVAKTKSLRIEN